MEEWIKSIYDAGVGVVISGGAIAEIAQHFLDKYDILVVKIGSKFELRRICKTLGAISIMRAVSVDVIEIILVDGGGDIDNEGGIGFWNVGNVGED